MFRKGRPHTKALTESFFRLDLLPFVPHRPHYVLAPTLSFKETWIEYSGVYYYLPPIILFILQLGGPPP